VNKGFYIIMAAQFFSSLADNALLVAAIALLMQAEAPSWLTPYLKFFFVVSYVVLAPYVGAFADHFRFEGVTFDIPPLIADENGLYGPTFEHRQYTSPFFCVLWIFPSTTERE